LPPANNKGVVMVLRGIRRARLGVATLAVVPALALAGCGSTTIDPSKTEQLIRTAVARLFTSGDIKVKSASCPNDVTAKAGGTFNCKVTLENTADGTTKSGAVTVHMTNASGHAEIGGSDFHVQ
jgi:hypothetical protein